jgi:hypothetical protein
MRRGLASVYVGERAGPPGLRHDECVAQSREGGWIDYASVSPERPAQLMENAERLHAKAEQRAAALHAEWFGGVADQSVTWVHMPLSQESFGWRADGYIANLPTAELDRLPNHEAQALLDGEPLWHPWEGPDSGFAQTGEVHPGDSPDPTWWQVSGLVYPNDTVRCWLADDSDVPVTRVGCWWIAEWVSRPQTLFVCVNDDEVDYIQPYRVHGILPPATYPYDSSTTNPRA